MKTFIDVGIVVLISLTIVGCGAFIVGAYGF